ncbi:MAG: hypothetical protein ACI4JG_07470 [Acutalibacteraceae bacterium]
MKLKLTKSISVVLTIAVIFSAISVMCFAYKDISETSVKMTYIDDCMGYIDHKTLSTVMNAYVVGNSAVSSVKIKMELQKLSSGTYSTVETWEQTFAGRTGDMEESKVTNPFSTYRLKATFTATSM